MPMVLQNKRVFVTGASGFIGSHLCETLEKHGVKLAAFIHRREILCEAEKIYGDLQQPPDYLRSFLTSFQPEIIFHLAAQAIVNDHQKDEMDTLRTNIGGTYKLLHACKGLPSLKSFVHISTDKVFGDTNPIADSSFPNGFGHPYNASKVAGENVAQMYSTYYEIPMVIVRNANVYGAGDTHFDRIIPRTINNVLYDKKPVVRGDGSNTRDYLHVSEIVDGYIRAAELPYSRRFVTLNLGGFNHSVIDVIDRILAKMRRIDIAPVFEEQWKGEIPHQHIEVCAAKELIGWNPQIDLDEGLDKTIPWYEERYGTS